MKLRNGFVIHGLIALAILAGTSAQAGERTPKDIQQALSSKGFNPGVIDGLWGKKSANALRDFQKTNGLAAAGKIDDATIAALFPEYPGLEDKISKPPDRIEIKTTDRDTKPAPSAEAASDQKTERVPAKIDAAPEKSVADIPTTTEVTSKALTTMPEVKVVANDTSAKHEETPRQPVAVYVIASIILAMSFFFIRKRKAKAPTALPPRHVDPAPSATAPNAASVFARSIVHRNDELAATGIQVPASRAIPVSSLAAHDAAVKDWVRQNAGRKTNQPSEPDNDALTAIDERSPATEAKQPTSLATHAAAVKQWVIENAEASRQRHAESQQEHFGARNEPLAAATSSTGWREKDSPTTVAGITIPKGLIYVGKSLGKDGRRAETENCLINPGLQVAQ